MATLNSGRIENVRLTKKHFELIAYTVRQEVLRNTLSPQVELIILNERAKFWSGELKYHNGNFNEEKFRKSIVTGVI